MTQRIIPAIIAFLPFVVAQTAAAQEAVPGLVCRVEGYDVALINLGETPVEAGTMINWSVRFSRSEGHHELDRTLEPGSLVMLNGVLGSSYLRSGTECRIEVDVDGM
jgi:hypothetical protein